LEGAIKQYRLYGGLHVGTGTDGHYASPAAVFDGAFQSSSPLVNGVVIGQIQVGDAVSPQVKEPFRVSTEHKLLHGWRADVSSRALQVAHNNVAVGKYGVYLWCEEVVNSLRLNLSPHATIQ